MIQRTSPTPDNLSVPSALSPSSVWQVWVLGAANMDISGSTDQVLVLGDSHPGRIRCTPGGVARNVAENMARLGHTTCLVTALGDDVYGGSLREATQAAGVDTHACQTVTGQATSTYLSIHGPDGDMVMAVNDMAILEFIHATQLAPCASYMAQADAIVVDCNLPAHALQWLFAQRFVVPVWVDAVSAFKCIRIRPWLGQVHTLKANRLELQALSGMPVDTDVQVQQAAQWLHTQGVRQVLVSLGERGVYWSDKQSGQGWQAAPSARADSVMGTTTPHGAKVPGVVNVTGAGDALLAGALHGFLNGQSWAKTIPFALACAALTITSGHANHPGLSADAVQPWLAQ